MEKNWYWLTGERENGKWKEYNYRVLIYWTENYFQWDFPSNWVIGLNATVVYSLLCY